MDVSLTDQKNLMWNGTKSPVKSEKSGFFRGESKNSNLSEMIYYL